MLRSLLDRSMEIEKLKRQRHELLETVQKLSEEVGGVKRQMDHLTQTMEWSPKDVDVISRMIRDYTREKQISEDRAARASQEREQKEFLNDEKLMEKVQSRKV